MAGRTGKAIVSTLQLEVGGADSGGEQANPGESFRNTWQRDAADLDTCVPLEKVVGDTTERVLNLGRRYGAAIEATLAGDTPEDAVTKAEAG